MNDYYKTLPKKQMGAGALIFNEQGEVLILKPNYKEHWTIPGGTVEENESPRQCCLREVFEETGIALEKITFLCIDYKIAEQERPESVQFIFYGGTLTPEQISKIKIQQTELDDYKFVSVNEAKLLLSQGLRNRLQECLVAIKKGNGIYLENGEKY